MAVADSEAVRSRRKRAHRAGDHSLCRPRYCPEATGSGVVAAPSVSVAPVLAELDEVAGSLPECRGCRARLAAARVMVETVGASAVAVAQLRGVLSDVETCEHSGARRLVAVGRDPDYVPPALARYREFVARQEREREEAARAAGGADGVPAGR